MLEKEEVTVRTEYISDREWLERWASPEEIEASKHSEVLAAEQDYAWFKQEFAKAKRRLKEVYAKHEINMEPGRPAVIELVARCLCRISYKTLPWETLPENVRDFWLVFAEGIIDKPELVKLVQRVAKEIE